MAGTLTIRLDDRQRALFDAEAAIRGVGPSTLARELVDERLRELRRARIYQESAEAAARYEAHVAAGGDVDVSDGFDPIVWDELAPYDGTVGGLRP
jgi:hypothetical protein